MRTLLEHQVVGFIVVPSYEPAPELVHLIGSGVPVVLLNRPIPGVELDLLGLDSYGDARLAVEHLIGHGRRRVATLLQPMRTPATREHLRGYQDATRAAGLPDDLFLETGVDWTDGEAATRALFARDPTIDALFSSSHLLTIGAYAALEALGRRIPDDVAIIGQNDLPWTAQLRSPLSVLHQSDQEFGTQAVRLLMDRLADPAGARRQVVCPERLILRRSCGCPWPRHAGNRRERGGGMTERLGDRFWAWATLPNALRSDATGIDRDSAMSPAAGAAYLGVPNIIMAGFLPPTDAEADAVKHLNRVAWEMSFGTVADMEANRPNFDFGQNLPPIQSLAARYPNVEAVLLDDLTTMDITRRGMPPRVLADLSFALHCGPVPSRSGVSSTR